MDRRRDCDSAEVDPSFLFSLVLPDMSISAQNPDIPGERQSGQDVPTQNVMAVANIAKTSLDPVGLDKENLLVSQPHCCKTTDDGSSSSAGCVFQALGEHLLRMKLSTTYEGELVCITALDPSSGLSFSLSFVNTSSVEESELLYEVVSLGTFERVAPK